MNGTPAKISTGWSSLRTPERTHVRRRDVAPALAAVFVLTLAHMLFGATQPTAMLALSALLIVAALASIVIAGPRYSSFGMIAGAAALGVFATIGAGGAFDRAAPNLAVLFAAGGMWIIGYVCARKRDALDLMWAGVVWSSSLYCAWMFFSQVNAVSSGKELGAITGGFETPASAPLLFGLLMVVGSAQVLHVVKQMDAKALARSEIIDRLMREALGGMLLLIFAASCLGLAVSRAGILLATAVLLGHMWWDTRSITSRFDGALIRYARYLAPLAAIAFAVGGICLAWLGDQSIGSSVGSPETPPQVQRAQAHIAAWLESPLTGHGLGSADRIGDQAMTLENAKAMLAPGDAQNVFVHWLVEGGVLGLGVILLFIGAMHVRIVASLLQPRTSQTFTRLAIAAGALLMLHGASDSSLDLPSVVWLYALLLGVACGVGTTKSSSRTAASQS